MSVTNNTQPTIDQCLEDKSVVMTRKAASLQSRQLEKLIDDFQNRFESEWTEGLDHGEEGEAHKHLWRVLSCLDDILETLLYYRENPDENSIFGKEDELAGKVKDGLHAESQRAAYLRDGTLIMTC